MTKIKRKFPGPAGILPEFRGNFSLVDDSINDETEFEQVKLDRLVFRVI